jgi:hypothetical protein
VKNAYRKSTRSIGRDEQGEMRVGKQAPSNDVGVKIGASWGNQIGAR